MGTRDMLTPNPKQMILDIEAVVPKIIRQRVDVSKTWLQTQTKNLQKQVTNVEEFVAQNNHLSYT